MLPNCPPKTLCGSSLMALAQSLDLATPCNPPCRCWQQGLRRWCLQNCRTVRKLSNILAESVEKICQFLYDLTLQKFSRIMNPKMSGWNIYRVPLVQSYTCDLYDGIFDRSGNLRRPMHPKILDLLLEILQKFLNMPSEEDANRAKMQSRARDRSPSMIRLGEAVPDGIFGNYNGLGRTSKFDPLKSLSGKNTGYFSDFGDSRQSDDTFYNGSHRNGSMEDKLKFGSYRFNPFESLGKDRLSYQSNRVVPWDAKELDITKWLDPFETLDKDKLNDGSNRAARRWVSKDPFSILGKDNTFMKKVSGQSKRGSREQNSTFLYQHRNSISSSRGTNNDSYDVKYISNLYGAVVKNPGTAGRLLSHSSRLGSRSPSIGKSERRYYGAQVPVLMHEPFDSQKPWTWQRRHPQQARVLQDGRMGNTKIHRYKRKSIQQEYDNLKQRYSLHSTFTNGSGSIGTAPMFGTPQSMGFVMLKPNYNRNSDPIKLQKRKIRR